MPEQVDHPDHYNVGEIETIEKIADKGIEFLEGFCIGSAIKYFDRADHKHKGDGKFVDLRKAAWYLVYYLLRAVGYTHKDTKEVLTNLMEDLENRRGDEVRYEIR